MSAYYHESGDPYHVLVINRKAGVMVASATPSRKRTVIRPPKLLQAAVRATTMPQMNVLAARYFATGRRVMRKVVGYSQKK